MNLKHKELLLKFYQLVTIEKRSLLDPEVIAVHDEIDRIISEAYGFPLSPFRTLP